MTFPNAPLFDDSTPNKDKILIFLNLESRLDCLEISTTPPIVLDPKSKDSGPRIILILLNEAMSTLMA